MKVWLDGEVVDGADARVPVTDHGFLYGDGIFEGIRIYGGRIFRESEHLDRLFESAKGILLAIREFPWVTDGPGFVSQEQPRIWKHTGDDFGLVDLASMRLDRPDRYARFEQRVAWLRRLRTCVLDAHSQ